jgi:glycosyltransferase involved in cell wall biosynthesis
MTGLNDQLVKAERSETASVNDSSTERGYTETPIRIAIVVSHPIQHFAPLHRRLAALPGVEVKVFFCLNWGATSHFDHDFGIDLKWDIPLLDGYNWEFLPCDRKVEKPGFGKVDNPSIADALESFRPDVVQVFGYAYRTMWRAVYWCRRKGIPVLLHSDSNASARTPFWKRLIKAAVVGMFYRHVDGAFFVGDNNFKYHLRYGLPEDRLFQGVLPIDRNRLTMSAGDQTIARGLIREEYGIPGDAFLAIFSGKLSVRKSPMHLLSAVERCLERGANIWAVFVGDGVERIRMEEVVNAHHIRNVVIAGFVNQSSIGKYYAASDVLVVTSAFDPHPLVLPEAGCFGLPAIVSDRLGCIGKSDTARVGESALVYPYSDIDALTNCMLKLYADKALYRSMSASALEIANSQDIGVAALHLQHAAIQLKEMGPRH